MMNNEMEQPTTSTSTCLAVTKFRVRRPPRIRNSRRWRSLDDTHAGFELVDDPENYVLFALAMNETIVEVLLKSALCLRS
jgi:hypothetical protein